ncbi:serine/threonine-protein kinase [Saccharothrix variisporea]|uniref:non-specific serine/threonine protein kinase n=1 Tax=Saccharothrix variisporea TaxID=543527 RepID=A0A495X3N3_9PSEU|nr:serine/threonine-protein kinase [Saccharothrix variisporea]RKT68612.1 serine/threonine protein kinase [Saccharothrix variisporea]
MTAQAFRGRLLADRYRLDGLVGAGGMAQVHRGWDVLLRRPVAIKLFPGVEDAVTERRIENEIRTLAALSHPGLVAVYDAGTSSGTRFVVMRLVEGRTLRAEINRGPLALSEVRRLGAAIADALAHVHAHGVVHRDLKPSNILLDADREPLLADFGLALSSGAARVTLSQQVVGTAPYLAPEQVRGGTIGPAVDVYALGLVLLECLSGRTEYDGGGVEAAVARLHRPPHVPSHLPSELVRLFSLMTAMTPRRRPTAEECARVLRGDDPPVPLPRPAHGDPAGGDLDTKVDSGPDTRAYSDPDTLASVEAVPDAPQSARRWLISGSLVAVLGLGGLAWSTAGTTPPATSSPDTSTVVPVPVDVAPVTPTSALVPETTRVRPVAETHPEPAPPAGKEKKGGKPGKGKG